MSRYLFVKLLSLNEVPLNNEWFNENNSIGTIFEVTECPNHIYSIVHRKGKFLLSPEELKESFRKLS